MLKSFKYYCIAMMVCCAFSIQTFAQAPFLSQYFASPLSINPALAGNGYSSWRVMAVRRNQWISSGVDPLNTTTASLDGKLLRQKGNENNYLGAGVMLVQDQGLGGAYKNNSFNLAFSSHISLDPEDAHSLAAGLGGSFNNTVIDYSQLTFSQQISSSGFNRALPTFETNLSNVKPYSSVFGGLTYSYKTEVANLEMGLACYQFLSSVRTSLQDPTQLDPARFNFHTDFQSYLGERTTFNANALFSFQKYFSTYSLGFNIGNMVGNTVEDEEPTMINTGIWYRHNQAISPYIGIGYGVMQAGISYDINISTSKTSLGPLQTFEFSLVFRSPVRVKSPVPCPWR